MQQVSSRELVGGPALWWWRREQGAGPLPASRAPLTVTPVLTPPRLALLVVGTSVQSLSRVRLFATSWTAARQASLSITNSQSLLKLMSWRRQWQPTPVFLTGESQGWGSLVGCHLWGRTESDTTEVT